MEDALAMWGDINLEILIPGRPGMEIAILARDALNQIRYARDPLPASTIDCLIQFYAVMKKH